MKPITRKRFRALLNPFFGTSYDSSPFTAHHFEQSLNFHRSLPAYQATPLHSLPGLAARLGLGEVLVKDESNRFGLPAFKVLGASYGIFSLLRKLSGSSSPSDDSCSRIWSYAGPPMTFCCATDGNHGRAVAWTARQLGQKAVVYVPMNTAPSRIEAIRAEGAQVVVIEGTYDRAVRDAHDDSLRCSCQVISDTAYEGYVEIPEAIMQGYGTLFYEACRQLRERGIPFPDAVFLQAGVGGLACAGIRSLLSLGSPTPKFIIVEPLEADCLLESACDPAGERRPARGKIDSLMAGLNAGQASATAWPVLRSRTDLFLAIDDGYAEQAVRALYNPQPGDPGVISGESGAAGLAGLLALCSQTELAAVKTKLGLDRDAVILLINTEGVTDPSSFRRSLEGSTESV